MLSSRMARLATLLAVLFVASHARSQQGRAPDPHWGAEIYPREDYEWRTSVALNRFTRFSSTSIFANRAFNEDVDKSAGFNLLTLQHTDEIDFDRRHKWTFTWTAGAGYAGDEPTQTLQNDYVHTIIGQNDVLTLRNESGFLWSAGFAVNCWFGDHSFIDRRGDEPIDESVRFGGVVGFGGAGSSLYYEPEIHAGASLDLPRYNVRFTGMHRVSTPIGGEIYRDVADLSQVTQASIYYVPRNFYFNSRLSDVLEWESLLPTRWLSGLHTAIGRPQVGIHVTHDTGLFEDVANNGISTWFLSLSFDWASGVRVEAWNDFLNGTDYGPTFGVMVGVDLLTFYDTLRGR